MAAKTRSGWRSKNDGTEDVGGQLVLSFGLLESLFPIGGGELEHAVVRPARQPAEQIADVSERLEIVEPCAGEQRDEDRVHPGTVIAADEEPVSTPENITPEVEFADVVLRG